VIVEQTRFRRNLRLALLSSSLCLGAAAARAAPYIFINLDAPFPGASRTRPTAINASRDVVGVYYASGPHAFHWHRGVFTRIDPPGAVSAEASDINDAGQVVGDYDDDDDDRTNHGFLWDNGAFTTIDPPNATRSVPTAINATGQVVGGYVDSVPPGAHAFLFDQGVFTAIDAPRFQSDTLATLATGINASGQIIGNWFDEAEETHGFLWENGTFTRIDGQHNTRPQAINDAGQVFGSYEVGNDFPRPAHAFEWVAGTFTTIDPPDAVTDPNGLTAAASDVNAAGTVAGSYSDSAFVIHAFLLQDGDYSSIDPPSSVGTVAIGINLHDDVIGDYLVSSGGTQAFVARSASVVNGLTHLNSIHTSFNGTPVPGGPAGTYTIVANFTNASSTPIDTPQFDVTQLSNGNLLLDADVPPGTVGSRLTADVGSDGFLSPGESFTANFVIGLQQRKAFTFFVDLLGVSEP